MAKEQIKTTCPHCNAELDVTAYVKLGRQQAFSVL